MAPPKQIKKRKNNAPTPFWQTLLHALENATDAQKLGVDSPLAAPYLLGSHLSQSQTTSSERGQVLKRLLLESIQQISGKNAPRYQQLLTEYYFQGHPVQMVCDSIGLGKTTFHDNRKRAISALESTLVNQLRPAIRLEVPPNTDPLVGRDAQLEQCQRALESGSSLSITGPSGSGKTAIGRYLYSKQQPAQRFWLTFRRGVNDNLDRVIFALGYFFARNGQPTLWQEVIANGIEGVDHALNLLRYAIAESGEANSTLLFCFDEVDLLEPTINADHVKIQQLLEGLSNSTNVVTIGHRALFATGAFCQLDTLTAGEIAQLLINANILLDAQQRAKLYELTRGNLHLLNLVLALYKEQKPIDSLLDELSQTPTMDFLLGYLLQRLSENECGLLMALCVYRNPAPADIWQQSGLLEGLAKVLDYRIAELDAQGGIQIVPTYRAALYTNLPDEKRHTLHAQAAQERSRRGSYTATAYHYIGAGQPENAIWLWREHRQQEINQGRGGEARILFATHISSQQLKPEARQDLALIRAELAHLEGQAEEAIKTVESVLWHTPILAVEAKTVGGNAARDLSDFEKADAYYRDALVQAEMIVETRLVQIHRGLSAVAIRQRELDTALREAQFARFEADNLEGFIHFMQYDYARAIALYDQALRTAKALDHARGIAHASINFARLHTQLGNFEQAIQHLERAEPYYQRIGNLAGETGVKINRALAHNLAGEHDRAITQLSPIASSVESIPPWQQALVAQNLAEAHLGLGEIDEAERFVRQAIAIEEEDVLADSYRTLGEIMLVRGEVGAAREHIEFSMEICRGMSEPDLYLLGYTWRALAQVNAQSQNFDEADRCWAAAIEIFEQINLPNEVEKTNAIRKRI